MGVRPAVAPFLKWAGGKARLAPRILERAPASFARYHEPFLGGGAVFFAFAAAGRAPSARLSDANAALIGCYGAVRDDPEGVISALEALANEYLALAHDERPAYYYRVRATLAELPVASAARLIFLNRTGYNGLYRENSRGEFNVPHGRYLKPRILDRAGLFAASAALSGATLCASDFEDACDATARGDFAYLDPPYHPLSATSRFTAYTRGAFDPAEQVRLRDAFEAMTRRGVAALLSNSDHERVRELYGDGGYGFEQVLMSRAINSVGSARAPIPELLIDNFSRPEVRAAFGDALPGSE